ncbi:MAG: DUF58 domain-containing protein [Phycisphaerae bacterium]|nr:DUF58 domain-containing protein [Phycisphaerae bacterium]
MIPQEILKQIRRLQIYSNRRANELFAGEYHSSFKGQGMEFDEVREYMPGDDIRSIDWNVTARMNKPFIKRYVEEREMTVVFVVDLSCSGQFGSKGQLRSEQAIELCSVLAFSAIKNNDKVGLITFSDRIERFIPPAKGTGHVLRVIRELLYHDNPAKGTDIKMALEYLAKVVRKKAIVFLVSDFIDTGFDKTLRLAARKHDLIAVNIADQLERQLQSLGIIDMYDSETGQRVSVDTASKAFRNIYSQKTQQQLNQLETTFRSAGVDNISLTVGESYIKDLIRFFKTREARR